MYRQEPIKTPEKAISTLMHESYISTGNRQRIAEMIRDLVIKTARQDSAIEMFKESCLLCTDAEDKNRQIEELCGEINLLNYQVSKMKSCENCGNKSDFTLSKKCEICNYTTFSEWKLY
jgi:hypothetical protein